MSSSVVTRFAPSPTGHLHLGHAYCALFAAGQAERAGGRFLLRLEDIDRTRCREAFAEAIFEDLSWLGLRWEEPVLRQSQRSDAYGRALQTLRDRDLIYPCFCTRKDIAREIAAAGSAPHGPQGAPYPGICRSLSAHARAKRIAEGTAYAWRLDMGKACAGSGPLYWHDERRGKVRARPEIFGDVVLARKDAPSSYHLSATVDDALQKITLVTRGEDLFQLTHIHRLLQMILGLETPLYHHHVLLCDSQGRRLAKHENALALRTLRRRGVSAGDVRKMIEEIMGAKTPCIGADQKL